MTYRPLEPTSWRPGLGTALWLLAIGAVLIIAAHLVAPLLAKDDAFGDMQASLTVRK